jgi:hypothetical protein
MAKTKGYTQAIDEEKLTQFRELYNEYTKDKSQQAFLAHCRSLGVAIAADTIRLLMEGRTKNKRVNAGTIYKVQQILDSAKQVA